MKIKSVHVRGFRSIRNAEITGCGGLNVLIGKNNSGKSTFLAAIEIAHRHLIKAQIAGPWATPRPNDEFTDRECDQPLQIGLEFELPPSVNAELRTRLQEEVPQLEKPIEQLKGHTQVAFVVAGVRHEQRAFLFIQHIGLGKIRQEDKSLQIEGTNLLSVTQPVATELFTYDRAIAAARSEVQGLERMMSDSSGRLDSMLSNREMARYYSSEVLGPDASPALAREMNAAFRSVSNREELSSRVTVMIAERKNKIEILAHKETDGTIAAFAGAAKTPPPYALWIAKAFGSTPMLHLRETRERIGREEANELLTLKVTRGGPERLTTLQRTVKSLLGVDVDAFQSDEPRRERDRSAEMDIDRFLVDANGAGVREALRLILDIELKSPKLVLIEEPEVHLHPGLEHAIHGYLREQGRDTQLFVTTHSTNFVDSVSFQNIYLVSKSAGLGTKCQGVDPGDGALKIPAELGLRLSSVFMFDRLVFVEGPSDEAILREFCGELNLDLAKANIGFVQMGGVRNFAHFAAQSTLDLLSHRQVRMWFIADRDERDDEEVARMFARLGGSARLKVLERRELENYLLIPDAIRAFISEKRKSAATAEVSVQNIEDALRDVSRSLKSEVVRLRLSRTLLTPIYLQNREVEGSIEDRIEAAVKQLQSRGHSIEALRQEVAADCERDWNATALVKAPGSAILEGTFERFGVRYRKEEGDSARLARFINAEAIEHELRALLQDISGSA